MSEFHQYRDTVRRESWPTFKVGLFIVLPVIVTLFVVSRCFSFAADAANVVQEQYSPSVLLAKYEWFKDARAALDAKVANIKVYEQRFSQQANDYGADRKAWPRDVREQNAIWQAEVSGVTASYNNLAAEYNAQMAKFNYRFTNVGDLPAGATEPIAVRSVIINLETAP